MHYQRIILKLMKYQNIWQTIIETCENYTFPQTVYSQEVCILHAPYEIYGVESDNDQYLLLGALAVLNINLFLHGCNKDNGLIKSSQDCYLIRISEPGWYKVENTANTDQNENVISRCETVEVATIQSYLVEFPSHQSLTNTQGQSVALGIPEKYQESNSAKPETLSVHEHQPLVSNPEKLETLSIPAKQLIAINSSIPQAIIPKHQSILHQ